MIRLITTLILVVAGTSHAWAWGSEGHRIVAEIAEQFLEPAAARQIHGLLDIENQTTLASVSTWADQIRGQRRNTSSWHYVNIPISASGYDASRDCSRGDCVVAKIDLFIKELRDQKVAPAKRLEALKFLVHFISDVHQPLHTADNGDRGGNDVHMQFQRRQTNLHAIWDTALLTTVVRGDERSYALKLKRSITPAEIRSWGSGTTASWANESHTVAAKVIYGALPHGPGVLPENYVAKALPVIDQQLKRAGIRLATVLNAVMK